MVMLSPVNANKMVFDVFPLSGSGSHGNGVWSITIYLNQAVDIYAQVSYVQSGTVPPSTFVWYVNEIAVKSDVIGSSTFTFAPTALGVYNITVTVNGETNSKLVTVNVISKSTPFNFVTPWVWDSPPKLIVESPINGTNIERALLNFTVEAPNNWFNNQSENWNDFNLYNTAIEQKLKSISYFLDGNLTTISVDSNLCLPYKGSVELTNLTEGTHQLIVYTNATGVYRSFRGFFAQTQINDSNKTAIVFTFTPKLLPTPLSNQASFPLVPVTSIAVAVVALAIVGLLVYLKKHKMKTV